MTSEPQRFLLRCLSDFIQNRPTENTAEPDWAAVFGLASRHSVDSIVYYQCKGVMPEEIQRKYLSRFVGEAVISIKREEITSDLVKRLCEKSIPAVYIKGSVFRDYYRLPPFRNMGDIDVVVRHEDRDNVDRILRSQMGFQRFIENHSVWTYWKENLYIELHDHMFYESLANKTDYRAYFEKLWEHIRNASVFGSVSPFLYVPDENFHFLYLMAHTAKHILNNGVGFRAYLDMILMTKTCEGILDWDRLAKELDQLELLNFTQTCFSCCERWFGIKMPLRRESLSENLFETITEKTFKDGIFGLENKENTPASSAKEIRQNGPSYYPGALKRTLRKLFPPYRDLQLVPWYSFIDGKPWLLPFVWIYRFFYCGIGKLKHSIKLLMEPFTKKKDVVKRQELMKEWGL